MEYSKLLDIAEKSDINISKLFIANEVKCTLKGYDKVDSNIFETICSLVYMYYLKIDYASVNDVTAIICKMYFNNEEITELEIRKKIENLYL